MTTASEMGEKVPIEGLSKNNAAAAEAVFFAEAALKDPFLSTSDFALALLLEAGVEGAVLDTGVDMDLILIFFLGGPADLESVPAELGGRFLLFFGVSVFDLSEGVAPLPNKRASNSASAMSSLCSSVFDGDDASVSLPPPDKKSSISAMAFLMSTRFAFSPNLSLNSA